MVQQFPILLWVIVYAGIGSGIDYIRTKTCDKYVLTFSVITGWLSGKAFQYFGGHYGILAGLIAAIIATTVICLLSFKFIKAHIISTDREEISLVTQEDIEWYENMKKKGGTSRRKKQHEK